jgi:adenine-specific DNA-methyltransferase
MVLGELGLADKFQHPKPVELIKKCIQIATEPDDIVLDSFGGSGTTAHAILAQNKEDGGNRKFILVECEDYADDITAERVRRVIKGVRTASDENLKKGMGGTFSYFELGKAIEFDSILDGKNLPSYLELARYVFYTATGEEFDERKLNEKRQFVGESKTHEVFLFYKPDIDYLKKIALTLDRAEELGKAWPGILKNRHSCCGGIEIYRGRTIACRAGARMGFILTSLFRARVRQIKLILIKFLSSSPRAST